MSIFDILILLFLLILSLLLSLSYFYKIFKSYQLHMYYLTDTLKAIDFDTLEVFLLELIVFFNFIFIFLQNIVFVYLCLIVFFILAILFCYKFKEKQQKNKLVFTKRFIRFFVVFITLFFIINGISAFLLFKSYNFGLILVNSLLTSFIIFILAHILILPVENLIKKSYIKKAQLKLKNCKNLKVIAITGSYGKTSVKNFVYDILKTKFKVCKTPNSFNTQMGITKVILNYLKEDDEFLILEMGADRLHDINKLCQIVKPDYSIITGVTNQHLNTFKTMENIINTKYELVQNTKSNGFVIFNSENEITKNYYRQTTNVNKILVSNKSFFAKNIKCDLFGTSFNLVCDNKEIIIRTKLLGEHNVNNLLLACRLALLLGLNVDEIKQGVEIIEPVDHRLKLIENNGKFILDDSFNANSESIKHSISILKTCKNKKIVITGGLVELGKDAYNENYKLGVLLKDIDYVIITNQINRKAILNGIKRKHNVFCVDNLNEAIEKLQEFYYEGDCVLFLNDLPDIYK